MSKVYTLSPCFRAENSLSTRHVSEFVMLEVEEAPMKDLDMLMDNVEDLVKSIADNIIENCPRDIAIMWNNAKIKDINKVLKTDYIR